MKYSTFTSVRSYLFHRPTDICRYVEVVVAFKHLSDDCTYINCNWKVHSLNYSCGPCLQLFSIPWRVRMATNTVVSVLPSLVTRHFAPKNAERNRKVLWKVLLGLEYYKVHTARNSEMHFNYFFRTPVSRALSHKYKHQQLVDRVDIHVIYNTQYNNNSQRCVHFKCQSYRITITVQPKWSFVSTLWLTHFRDGLWTQMKRKKKERKKNAEENVARGYHQFHRRLHFNVFRHDENSSDRVRFERRRFDVSTTGFVMNGKWKE